MVSIDMRMPDTCVECPCHVEFFPGRKNPYSVCQLEQRKMGFLSGYEPRPKWCPLIEITEDDVNALKEPVKKAEKEQKRVASNIDFQRKP